MTAASPPMIELVGVSKSYDAGPAIRDVTLQIAQRSFVSLVGASGSGKTTTLKTINRLITPDSGVVRIAGEDVAARPAWALRRGIGYVFQGIGLFPHMDVGENIAITLTLLGWDRARIADRVQRLLDLVELPRSAAGRRASELSGGQQQRVGLARAMAAEPAVLLMDEPFGALDPVTRDNLGQACRKLHDEAGLTTVLVTHDVTEAIVLSDRIVVMDAGQVVADGSAGELMGDRAHPKVAALMQTPRRQAAALDAALSRGSAPR